MKKYFVYIFVLILGVLVFYLQFNYGKKYKPYTFYQVYLDNEKIGIINSKDDFEKHIQEQGSVIKSKLNEYSIDVEKISSVKSIIQEKVTKDCVYYKDYLMISNVQKMYDQINNSVDNNYIIVKNENLIIELLNKLNQQFNTNAYVEVNKIENYENLKNSIDSLIATKEEILVNYLYQNKEKLKLTSTEINDLDYYINNNLSTTHYSKYKYMVDFVETNKIYLTTEDVYAPLGINIQKINTYNNEYDKVEEVYDKIIDKKPCTIEGYQFRIKQSSNVNLNNYTLLGADSYNDYKLIDSNSTTDIYIYVTDPSVFNEAIDGLTAVFVGSDAYDAYKNNDQKEIKDVGVKIENVFLKEDITIKQTNISVKEKIFSDSESLTSYLLYGDTIKTKTVYATSEDTITNFAYKNGITIEEFFLSNPSFTSIDNIFYDGQPITITTINPKVSLVVEESQIVDKDINYNTVEKYDDTLVMGSEKVEQNGVKGTMRVSQVVQKVNGSISYVNPIGNETIKNPKDKVVLIGTKVIPNVGSTTSWGWPTNSGYTLTSYFGWRRYPFDPGRREFHAGLDIAGTGHGSPIYASNNGTIVSIKSERWNYGNSIIINHNNGYWTNYGHMSGFASGLKVGDTVSRGQVIGYMGKSGAATGTHLHFEIRKGENRYANVVDPLPYLRK